MKTSKNNKIAASLVLSALILSGCGSRIDESSKEIANLPSVGIPGSDGSVVRARAIYNVSSEQSSMMSKLMSPLLIQSAYASETESTTVTYSNAPSTLFTINVNNFKAGAIINDILDLGSVGISGIADNNLKVCGTDGKKKCTEAAIRVYTVGSIAGFVNTDDLYGAPIYTGTLNPKSEVGLGALGAVDVQKINIASNKNTIKLTDFSNPNYFVTSNFYNAGAGSYSMTYVVEYVLRASTSSVPGSIPTL